MVHDSSIRPKTPSKSMSSGLSFIDFLDGGIFALGNIVYNKDIIRAAIQVLSAQKLIVYVWNSKGIPNLFAILKQRGTWKFDGQEWVLSTATWEKKTIYSVTTLDDHNVFQAYVSQLYAGTVLSGFAWNQQFLKKTGLFQPWVAVDMTHSTGAGAWGSEIVRGGKAFTHTTGILDAGIGFKGFASVNSTMADVKKKLNKNIINALKTKNNTLSNIVKKFNKNYADLTINQQRQINKNLQLTLNEQKQALQTLTTTRFIDEGLSPMSITFTIFGITFKLGMNDDAITIHKNGVNITGNAFKNAVFSGTTFGNKSTKKTALLGGKIPFLSKPQVLKMITPSTINHQSYILRFSKYMGDFFQCIAYSHIQNVKNGEPIFITGDGSCGLGYFLTKGYIGGSVPSFMADRKGMAAENIKKPTLFYCLPPTREFQEWVDMGSVEQYIKLNVETQCILTMRSEETGWSLDGHGKNILIDLGNQKHKVEDIVRIIESVMELTRPNPPAVNDPTVRCTYYMTTYINRLLTSQTTKEYINNHNTILQELWNIVNTLQNTNVVREEIMQAEIKEPLITNTRGSGSIWDHQSPSHSGRGIHTRFP